MRLVGREFIRICRVLLPCSQVSSTGIQEILSKMNELKHGFLGSEINIDGRIPDELVGAGDTVPSLKASLVGQDVNLTRFLRDQVIKNINEEWTPFELPAEAGEDIRTAHDLKLVVEKAGLGYMRVENDNQFNRKVNIKDSFGRRCYFVSRIDGLIVANPILANSQADSIENIMKQAIAFVEIESGEKGMENAEIQLLSSMMAIAASIQKNFLYGVVINKTFDKARLVKFYLECCCADGCFHPAVLGTVGVQLMTKHP